NRLVSLGVIAGCSRPNPGFPLSYNFDAIASKVSFDKIETASAAGGESVLRDPRPKHRGTLRSAKVSPVRYFYPTPPAAVEKTGQRSERSAARHCYPGW